MYGPPVGGGILRCGSVAFNRRRLGVWGKNPQPLEARGPGGRAPSARKFCIFLAKITYFRPILIKIMLLKHGIKISICKSMFILVTYMGFVGGTGSYC